MSIDHNRIKVADLEKNQPNKILTTKTNGELEFSNISDIKIDSYNALDYTVAGKALDARQGKVLKDSVDSLTGVVSNKQVALGFTPENSANKIQDIEANKTLATTYPSSKGVYDWGNKTFQKKTTSIKVIDDLVVSRGGSKFYYLQPTDEKLIYSGTDKIYITIDKSILLDFPVGSKYEITTQGLGVIGILNLGGFIGHSKKTISNASGKIMLTVIAEETIEGIFINPNRLVVKDSSINGQIAMGSSMLDGIKVFDNNNPITATLYDQLGTPIGSTLSYVQKGDGVVTLNPNGNTIVTDLTSMTTVKGETRVLTKIDQGVWTAEGSNKSVTDAEKEIWNAKQPSLGFTPENVANKNIAGGYAGLGADGKLIASQLPSITISDTFVTTSQVEMLAVRAETGDIAVRTDLNKSFILKGLNSTVLADWQELLTPTSAVSSVFGRSGAVTAQSGDYLTSQVPEVPNRRYQTDNQAAYNDATSSIQSQLNAKQLAGNYEPAFAKNTAFNKNFGTTTGTVIEGNDVRIVNGQKAFEWGNHAGLYRPLGYVPSWSDISLKPTTIAGFGITDAAKSIGTTYFRASTTTASFLTDLSNKGFLTEGFTTGKVSWDYAGNSDIADTGFGAFELAGTSLGVWNDGTNRTILAIAPNTGAAAGQVLIYNDQGAGYSPGWRKIYTSNDFSSNNIANWNIAHGWGNHTGLYPTYNGAGASGTWGISITGNANTSSYSTLLSRSNDTGNLITSFRNTTAGNKSWHDGNSETDAPIAGQWFNVESMRHSNPSNVYGTQQAYLWGGGNPDMFIRQVNNDTFGSWARVLNSTNYNSYSPTLTGTGASGTWGINISGNASTVGGLAASSFMKSTSANGYYGMARASDGDTTDWIRTTVNGLIPYQPGNSGSIGTSSWNFNSIYGVTLYENNSPLVNKYLTLSGGTITGPLRIAPNTGNYSEGIRIANSTTAAWSNIQFGTDGTATGLNADGNQWLVGKNPAGQFLICPNNSDSTFGLALNKNGNATWYNDTLLHTGNHVYSTTSGTVAAAYFGTTASATAGVKVRLPVGTNFTTAQMVSFNVHLYQSYETYIVNFSGYLYPGILNWYTPRAIMVVGSSSINAIMGKDADGTPYVWLTGGNYTGAAVFNVVSGYQSGNFNTGWTITMDGSVPSQALNTTVYPNIHAGNIASQSVAFASKSQRANGNFYIDDNYGCSIVGLYNSGVYQGVFSMGDSYKPAVGGASLDNHYGIAWTHTNVGGQSKGGLSHQMLVVEAGITKTAIGTGIWTVGKSSADRFYTNPAGDPNISDSFYCGNWFRSKGASGWYNQDFGGGIWMDNSSAVKVYGGKPLRSDNGFCGSYDSTTTAMKNIWSISESYNTINSNLYGMAYDYAGGNSVVNEHQIVLQSGGVTRTRLGLLGNAWFNGTVTASGFYASSDIRLKKVIKHQHKNISGLKAISYKWKDKSKGKITQLGYSAQEVQKMIPNAVSEDEDGFLSVNYIQVLVAKIEALELVRDKQNQLMDKLEERIKKLEHGI
jgi:hypothetical protein